MQSIARALAQTGGKETGFYFGTFGLMISDGRNPASSSAHSGSFKVWRDSGAWRKRSRSWRKSSPARTIWGSSRNISSRRPHAARQFPQAYSHVGLINAAFAVSPSWTTVLEPHACAA